KSSLIRCLHRAVEAYSLCDEGALYTFSWVFPSKRRDGAGGIGFGAGGGRGAGGAPASFAYLPAGDLDARVPSEVRDHPLLLLPRPARVAWLRAHLGADAPLPRALAEGELSAKSAQIYEALLKSYQGDVAEVLRHVQVERFDASRRYRRALSTVDPQLRADAHARQLTADRSLAALPAALQHLSLFEAGGPLVEGNRGVVELNDLLKRPVEAFKYLLATCETGAVRLEGLTLYLDALLIGSCNFEHLEAFKEAPEFGSFKGRLELVQVPYLRDFEREEEVYAPQLAAMSRDVDVAPGVGRALALWAVMTRFERPQPVHFDPALKELIEDLTALEKARLYATGAPPARLSAERGARLAALAPALYAEPQPAPLYEGLMGASARELKALLMALASEATARAGGARPHITPLHVTDALLALCEHDSLYPFLRRKPSGGFYQPKTFAQWAREDALERFEALAHDALGLVSAAQVGELFDRYVEHLTSAVRGERRLNAVTGAYEPADESLMRDVEKRLGRKHTPEARGELVQRAGSWRLEHPEGPLDPRAVFAAERAALQESFVRERRAEVRAALDALLRRLDAALRPADSSRAPLSPEEAARADDALARLAAQGYSPPALRDLVAALL
ncbi:MAG: serine protein kinase PrkA, partial [Deltaproteobacteria bacterium]|nr:serine protein kinase PrkA [Deltaproteobacteria bacterium]